jgi:hypothetical protein
MLWANLTETIQKSMQMPTVSKNVSNGVLKRCWVGLWWCDALLMGKIEHSGVKATF